MGLAAHNEGNSEELSRQLLLYFGVASPLDLQLKDRDAWTKAYDAQSLTVSCLVAAPEELLGQDVRVQVSFEDSNVEAILHGIVTQITGPIAIVQVRELDQARLDYLSSFARGGMLDLRSTRRLPISLRCQIDGTKTLLTRDISDSGVFVVTEQPIAEGRSLKLRVLTPCGDFETTGTISHTVLLEDEDVPGMAIMFTSQDKLEDIAKIMDCLEHRFLMGDLDDELIF